MLIARPQEPKTTFAATTTSSSSYPPPHGDLMRMLVVLLPGLPIMCCPVLRRVSVVLLDCYLIVKFIGKLAGSVCFVPG